MRAEAGESAGRSTDATMRVEAGDSALKVVVEV
jgi:hypothetical protein